MVIEVARGTIEVKVEIEVKVISFSISLVKVNKEINKVPNHKGKEEEVKEDVEEIQVKVKVRIEGVVEVKEVVKEEVRVEVLTNSKEVIKVGEIVHHLVKITDHRDTTTKPMVVTIMNHGEIAPNPLTLPLSVPPMMLGMLLLSNFLIYH